MVGCRLLYVDFVRSVMAPFLESLRTNETDLYVLASKERNKYVRVIFDLVDNKIERTRKFYMSDVKHSIYF